MDYSHIAMSADQTNTRVTPQSMHERTAPSKHQQLVTQTRKWVAMTFFGPMLKQMRESPFKSDLLDGGRGGQAFSEMYDQQLAERMSRGAGNKLVNSIVRRIEAKEAYENQKSKVNMEREGADRVRAIRQVNAQQLIASERNKHATAF